MLRSYVKKSWSTQIFYNKPKINVTVSLMFYFHYCTSSGTTCHHSADRCSGYLYFPYISLRLICFMLVWSILILYFNREKANFQASIIELASSFLISSFHSLHVYKHEVGQCRVTLSVTETR